MASFTRYSRSCAIAGQEFGQPFVSEPARGSPSGDLVPQIQKRPDVPRPRPLVILATNREPRH